MNTMDALQKLYAPLPTDSAIVRKSKAEIAATLSGRDTFEFDGKVYRCQTREQAMHYLGLNARWRTLPESQDRPL